MRTLSGLGTLPIVAFFWVGKMMSDPPGSPGSPLEVLGNDVDVSSIFQEADMDQDGPKPRCRAWGQPRGANAFKETWQRLLVFVPLNVQPVCSKKAPWCFERFCAICHLVLTFLDVRNIPKSIWATSFISKVLGSFRFNRGILNSRTVLVTSIYCTIATKTPTAP